MKNNLNVVYYRDDEEHATALLRYYSPAFYLNKHGFRCTFRDSIEYDEKTGKILSPEFKDADVVISGQFLFASELPIFKMMKKAGKKLILDADDWYMESHMKREKKDLEAYKEIVKLADAITVCSPYLGKLYEKYLNVPAEKIFYVPNYALVSEWEYHFKKQEEKREQNKNGITIGIMGASNHLRDWLRTALPVLEEIKKLHPEVRIQSFGVPKSLAAFFIHNKDLMTEQFLEDCMEAGAMMDRLGVERIDPVKEADKFPEKMCQLGWDIGLATLSNTRTDKGKSFLKYMDYGLSRIAGVYQGISPFTDVIVDKENGLVANSKTEWVESICKLIEDKELRKNITENAAKDINDNHNMDKGWKTWADVIKEVVTNR